MVTVFGLDNATATNSEKWKNVRATAYNPKIFQPLLNEIRYSPTAIPAPKPEALIDTYNKHISHCII